MADGTFDPPGNCSTTDVTLNGSHYVRNDANDIRSQSRAVTTDHGESALSEAVDSSVIAGNVVSPAASWSDNYQQFTAEFDPETLGGHYSHVWQRVRWTAIHVFSISTSGGDRRGRLFRLWRSGGHHRWQHYRFYLQLGWTRWKSRRQIMPASKHHAERHHFCIRANEFVCIRHYPRAYYHVSL